MGGSESRREFVHKFQLKIGFVLAISVAVAAENWLRSCAVVGTGRATGTGLAVWAGLAPCGLAACAGRAAGVGLALCACGRAPATVRASATATADRLDITAPV